MPRRTAHFYYSVEVQALKITIVWQQFGAIAFLQVRSSSGLRIFGGNNYYITTKKPIIKMDSY